VSPRSGFCVPGYGRSRRTQSTSSNGTLTNDRASPTPPPSHCVGVTTSMAFWVSTTTSTGSSSGSHPNQSPG